MGGSLELSALDREKVMQWIAAHGTPQQVALRCRIVLSSAQGESDVAIARRLMVNRNTVILWRKCFVELGSRRFVGRCPGPGAKANL
jgi:hypothetical protein